MKERQVVKMHLNFILE
jgi:hypothetical protein